MTENFSYDKAGKPKALSRDYSGDNFPNQYSYDNKGNINCDATRIARGLICDSRSLPFEMTIMQLNNQYMGKFGTMSPAAGFEKCCMEIQS